MKLSDAILKGMERFPDQNKDGAYFGAGNSACAMGCAFWAYAGEEVTECGAVFDVAQEFCIPIESKFFDQFGVSIIQANDQGIPREDIAGMLKAIGE